MVEAAEESCDLDIETMPYTLLGQYFCGAEP